MGWTFRLQLIIDKSLDINKLIITRINVKVNVRLVVILVPSWWRRGGGGGGERYKRTCEGVKKLAARIMRASFILSGILSGWWCALALIAAPPANLQLRGLDESQIQTITNKLLPISSSITINTGQYRDNESDDEKYKLSNYNIQSIKSTLRSERSLNGGGGGGRLKSESRREQRKYCRRKNGGVCRGRNWCPEMDVGNRAYLAPTVFEGKARSMSSSRKPGSNYAVTFEVKHVYKSQAGYQPLRKNDSVRLHFRDKPEKRGVNGGSSSSTSSHGVVVGGGGGGGGAGGGSGGDGSGTSSSYSSSSSSSSSISSISSRSSSNSNNNRKSNSRSSNSGNNGIGGKFSLCRNEAIDYETNNQRIHPIGNQQQQDYHQQQQQQPQHGLHQHHQRDDHNDGSRVVRADIKRGKVYLVFVNRVGPRNFTILGEPVIRSKKNEQAVQAVVRPDYVREVTLSELRDSVARTRERIKLVCRTRGSPPPRVHWLKDGVPLYPRRGLRIQHKRRRSKVVIASAREEDSGRYECIAQSTSGYRASLAAQLLVTNDAKIMETTTVAWPRQEQPCPIAGDFCMNGGTCLFFETVGEPACRCAEGFTGLRCETKDVISTGSVYNRHRAPFSCKLGLSTSYYC
ncbi:hypothetical protein PV327_000903 [Microctonus hyperodae]|uniref:Protein vein n=1 Tax=Microctonus hyperodae TaxID=165561 RepID=A0AA39G747_MICHY|nr:hypothetical protein PV327_000903 [Microctonus hyperodae]